MPHGREFSIQERWHLQYGRGTQHRDPHRVPSAPFPEPQTPVSPRVSSLLCPPSAGAQSEWLQMRVCALACKRALVHLAASHLSLVDRIPTDFCSQILCGYIFLAMVFWALHRSSTPCYSGGTFTAKTTLWNLILPWEKSQPFSFLYPSYQPQCGFFCKSLIVRLLFSNSSIGYSGLLF